MSPQTKTLVGIAAVIAIGAGAWFLYTGRSEISYNRVSPEEASKAVAVLSKDTDGDDLKDWEEELWHTDKARPDTDEDGTPDGEEVKLGRNPTKAGPDDALDKETIEAKTVPGGGSWTETDRLSRELFAKYLAIKQSGAPFTAADEEALLEDFLSRYPEAKQSKLYAEGDIRLSATDDATALRAYGNALGTVINNYKEKEGAENEVAIFERALQNDDELDLANLDGRIKRYDSMLTEFKAVPVPKSAAAPHLDLLNAIEALKESTEGMAGAFTDSVRALSAGIAYPDAITKLTKAFSDLSGLLKERGVVFGENEPGNILTN